MSSDEESDREIKGRLHSLEWTVRCFGVGIVVAAGGLAVSVMNSIPRYQKIFEEMLGTADKLPGITRMVMNGQGTFLLGSIFGTVVGVILALQLPKKWAAIGFGGVTLLLVILWLTVQSATAQPLTRIIFEMSGG